jgi:hypothetical protein
MPLRVNYSGVMPIIFGQAILMFPRKSSACSPGSSSSAGQRLNYGTATHNISLRAADPVLLLLLGGHAVQSDPDRGRPEEIWRLCAGHPAGQAHGGVPGSHHDPHHVGGRDLPVRHRGDSHVLAQQFRIPWIVASFFGGTSLLITVGVMLDTMRQIESHLVMRYYDGFLTRASCAGGNRSIDMQAIILLGAPGSGKGTVAEDLKQATTVSPMSPPATCCARPSRRAAGGQGSQGLHGAGRAGAGQRDRHLVQERAAKRARPMRATCSMVSPHDAPGGTAWTNLLADNGRSRSRVLLEVPRALIIDERISGRRVCRQCGQVYHLSRTCPRRKGYVRPVRRRAVSASGRQRGHRGEPA